MPLLADIEFSMEKYGSRDLRINDIQIHAIHVVQVPGGHSCATVFYALGIQLSMQGQPTSGFRRPQAISWNSTRSYQCQASLSGLGLSASHKRSHGIHECKRKGNSAPGKSLLSQVAESPFEYNLPRSNSYVIEIGWNIYTMA